MKTESLWVRAAVFIHTPMALPPQLLTPSAEGMLWQQLHLQLQLWLGACGWEAGDTAEWSQAEPELLPPFACSRSELELSPLPQLPCAQGWIHPARNPIVQIHPRAQSDFYTPDLDQWVSIRVPWHPGMPYLFNCAAGCHTILVLLGVQTPICESPEISHRNP